MKKKQNASLVKYVRDPSKAQFSSYKVAYRTVQCKQRDMIGQNIMLPSAVGMVTIGLGEFSAKQLFNTPLSNDVVCHNTEDVNEQLTEKKKQIICHSDR
jgi:hypothetical protein